LFAFFLPFRDAPKTIFWALYIVTWLINRIPSRSFGGPWKLWDTVALASLASGVLAAAFAGIRTPSGREWLALKDPFMQAALLLCLWRGRYGVGQWKTLFGMLIFSCVISELGGLWLCKIAGSNQALQLKSVGHVNHSAIYLAIMTGVSFTWTFCAVKESSRRVRVGLSAASIVLFVGVLMSDSRAAVGTGVALVCLLALVALRWRPIRKVWASIIFSAIALTVITFGQNTLSKHLANAKDHNQLAYRDKIWARGTAAWRASPLFGVGNGNFIEISDAKLIEWLAAKGETFDSETHFFPMPHAHSLFVNTLAETGLIGLGAMILFLSTWSLGLLATLPSRGAAPENLLFWGVSFSAWLISTAAGLANTTFHHEHALVSIILLAAWLSWRHSPHAIAPSSARP
jgi:O-antigen ligase